MKIIRHDEVKGSERHVFGSTGTWDSQRYILADDGVGFSFHITTLYKDAKIPLWYKNHVEAVYVIAGSMGISWRDEDGYWQEDHLNPGDLYLLNGHDRHELYPDEDTVVACVFNPAVTGTEDHDADGAYVAPTGGLVSVHRLRLEELERVERLYYQGYRNSDSRVWAPRERYEELMAEVESLRDELAENEGVIKVLRRQRDEAESREKK